MRKVVLVTVLVAMVVACSGVSYADEVFDDMFGHVVDMLPAEYTIQFTQMVTMFTANALQFSTIGLAPGIVSAFRNNSFAIVLKNTLNEQVVQVGSAVVYYFTCTNNILCVGLCILDPGFSAFCEKAKQYLENYPNVEKRYSKDGNGFVAIEPSGKYRNGILIQKMGNNYSIGLVLVAK